MIERILQGIYDVIWSPALVCLLVGAGLYFTIRTRCVQLRRLGLMVHLMRKSAKRGGTKSFSPFQAFCMSLSGRVGTGNIVGVATAIAIGGPGAIFWMWVITFLGASTAFAESTLAQIYRFKHNGGFRGGPFSYIEKGLHLPWLGVVFAIMMIIGYSSLILVQSNSMSMAFHNTWNISPALSGVVLAVLLGIVLFGGMKRMAHVATLVTPFMALAYILMAIAVIGLNIQAVPGVFKMIFTNAFAVNPLVGGIFGSTVMMGVKRGLFSNEAGQGGGAVVSGSASNDHPAAQGLVQAFSVYIDTFLICTSTALMILCTGSFNVVNPVTGELLYAGAPELGSNYVAYTQAAIDKCFAGVGAPFVAIALGLFVSTTIMAYYFYTETSVVFLYRNTNRRHFVSERMALNIYRVVVVVLLVFGSVETVETVWMIGDIGVGLTAWVNVLVLLVLFPQALSALKEYEKMMKK